MSRTRTIEDYAADMALAARARKAKQDWYADKIEAQVHRMLGNLQTQDNSTSTKNPSTELLNPRSGLSEVLASKGDKSSPFENQVR